MKNTLDFISILSTLLQAEQAGKTDVVEKLDFILTNNEIEKPEKHNRKDDLTTSYFRIEVSKNELNDILDIISNSISNSFDENNEPTSSTYMFEDLIDKWNKIEL